MLAPIRSTRIEIIRDDGVFFQAQCNDECLDFTCQAANHFLKRPPSAASQCQAAYTAPSAANSSTASMPLAHRKVLRASAAVCAIEAAQCACGRLRRCAYRRFPQSGTCCRPRDRDARAFVLPPYLSGRGCDQPTHPASQLGSYGR